MKGVEELPLKYLAMILAAALIVGAIVYSTNILSSVAIGGTNSANSSLHALLNSSLANVLK